MLLFGRGRLVRTARVMAVRRQRGRKTLGRLGDESEVQHQSTNNQAAESARLHGVIITHEQAVGIPGCSSPLAPRI